MPAGDQHYHWGDPVVTEALGLHVDFFWIDLEHTPMSLESLQGHLIAARAVGVPALVRVPSSDHAMIKRVLDTGAGGVIVPQVRSVDEVKYVVDSCRYIPRGKRGCGPRRASNFGADETYYETNHQDLFVSVQIENVEALEAVEQIVEVPGLNSLVLGPVRSSPLPWVTYSRTPGQTGSAGSDPAGDQGRPGARFIGRNGRPCR